MAKISIKTDFKDGDKLFAVQLNNNFKTIQEAWDAVNGIVWQGDENEDVVMYKGTTEEIENKSVINGQVLWNTETGETYLDANDERINTGSGNVVSISETEPTNAATKIWVDTDGLIDKMYYNENGIWKELLSQPSGDTLPIGSIAQFGGENAPTNWLLCNGQTVSRETYSELFDVIGTTYGAGDGSTTFNVPDFSSRTPIGVGTGTDDNIVTETTTLGQSKGEYKHTLTVDEMPEHNHELGYDATDLIATGSDKGDAGRGLKNNPPEWTTFSAGGNQSHNIIQPVLGVNFIIKAKQSAGVIGDITTNITDENDNAVPNAKTVKNYVDTKSLDVYATTETLIGTYKGKPLYRKVIETETPSGSSEQDIASVSDVDTMVDIRGTVINEVDAEVSYPYWFNSGNYGILFYRTNTGAIVNSNAYKGYQGQPITMIVEYTKTTD